MKTIYKVLCTLCLIAASITNSYAASEAEYGKVAKSWILNADGSQEYRYSMELTLFTHTAMNSTYGESFILYNPKFQELEIITSYTRQKDGTRINTPENAFVEVLPRNAADAPAYNHLKEMVVVHTGLELGATIYLEYVLKTKPGYFAALDISEFLQETSPVKTYSATVCVPENTPIHCQLTGTTVRTTEEIKNGIKTINCTLNNVPALSREPFQAQNRNNSPRLTASTYSSLEDALAILSKSLHIGTNMEAEAFATYTTEEATTGKEKAELIQKHIVQNMGTCQVTPEQTGYKTRNASLALRTAYGTLAEKAILLTVMLNAVEVPAEIVVIYPGNMQPVGLKSIKGFAVKAKIDGKNTYLSPASMVVPTIEQRGELDQLYTLSGKPVEVKATPLTIAETKEVKLTKEQSKNGYIVYTLPIISKGIDVWGVRTLNTQRSELFELPAMLDEEITYVITLDEGINIKASAPVSISNAAGQFSQTMLQEGNKVTVKRAIKLNKQQYLPAEYRQMRELINEWVNPSRQTLLFPVN
ncbi:DUF3857 domain-containing protein [Parabacteroides sp. OttesenSCG-928-K15]|nr:DUF3857 domain-containing protein [Parabacteroides sp. OttesenSCG-928-K15]